MKKIIIISSLFFILIPTATAHAQACLSYPSGTTAPSGYAQPWDVYDGTHPLLVKTNCPTSGTTLNLTIGKGDPANLAYKISYSYHPGMTPPWQPQTLSGTVSSGDWLAGNGTGTLTAPLTASATNPFFFVGYTCQLRSSVWKCGCADTSCTTGKWQLQGYKGLGGGTSTTGGTSAGTISEGGGVVKVIPGRTVHMLPNDPGSGIQERIQIGTPADEYYLDFNVKYDNRYDWDSRDQSGKFPGLAGGAKEGGGNCTGEQPNSWSARNGFQNHGRMTTYLYFQNRNSGCGVKYQWTNPDGSDFYFQRDRWYRFTQRVRVNTPGRADGHNQIWVDGVEVYKKLDMEWRGNVDPSVARVDQVMFHAFFGGDTIDKTASYDSYVHFGDMYVMSCTPDFSKIAGICR